MRESLIVYTTISLPGVVLLGFLHWVPAVIAMAGALVLALMSVPVSRPGHPQPTEEGEIKP